MNELELDKIICKIRARPNLIEPNMLQIFYFRREILTWNSTNYHFLFADPAVHKWLLIYQQCFSPAEIISCLKVQHFAKI